MPKKCMEGGLLILQVKVRYLNLFRCFGYNTQRGKIHTTHTHLHIYIYIYIKVHLKYIYVDIHLNFGRNKYKLRVRDLILPVANKFT